MITRRAFFGHLVREVVTTAEEARGHRHLKLSGLRALPAAQLIRIVPRVDLANFTVRQGAVFSKAAGGAAEILVLPLDPIEQAILGRMSGAESLEQIASRLWEDCGLSFEAAAPRTRELFLRLVDWGVCTPASAIPEAQ